MTDKRQIYVTVLQMGGTASRSVIAKEIALEDSVRMGDQTAYEDIVMELPGQVLQDRGWVLFDKITNEYTLTFDMTRTTEDEVNARIRSCELRIKTYQATGTSGGCWVNDRPKHNPRDQMLEIQEALEAVGEFDPTGQEAPTEMVYQGSDRMRRPRTQGCEHGSGTSEYA